MAKKLITKEEPFRFVSLNDINLNDLKTPGFYHTSTNTANTPSNSNPGIIFVYSLNDDNDIIIIQFYISYFLEAKLKLFVRNYSLNSWSSWITI